MGHSETDQSPEQAARRGADPRSRRRGAAGDAQRGCQRAAGHDGTDSGDGDCADADQQPDEAAEHAPADRPGGGAFHRTRAGLGRQLALGGPVAHGDTDLLPAEPAPLQLADRAGGVLAIPEQCDHNALAANAR